MLVGTCFCRLTIRRYTHVRRYNFMPTPLTASQRISRHNIIATDSLSLQTDIATASKSIAGLWYSVFRKDEEKIQEINHNIKKKKSHEFKEDDQGVWWYKGRIYVTNIKKLKDKILYKAHESAYSIHPERNKMYNDLKTTYCWYEMKSDIIKVCCHL
jgi:hypothetical protein